MSVQWLQTETRMGVMEAITTTAGG
jgi:hypothetical protein